LNSGFRLTILEIEVYEFPDDCYSHELISYFEGEPFKAYCQTSEDDLKDEDTGNFIMEFTEPGTGNFQLSLSCFFPDNLFLYFDTIEEMLLG